MKYKFFGQPNMLVKGRKKVYYENKLQFKPLFRFDANGEYVTDDERLIEKLKTRFDHKPVSEEPEGSFFIEVEKLFTCKKCGEQFDNKGKFLAHSRKGCS